MRKQFIILSSLLISTFAQADVPVYDAYQHEPGLQQNISVQNTQAAPVKQYVPPVSTRNLSTSQRLALLEQQSAYQAQQNYSQQITSLQQEVQSLRGQLDVATHESARLQQQLQNMFQDLDNRVSKLGGGAAQAQNGAQAMSSVYTNTNPNPGTQPAAINNAAPANINPINATAPTVAQPTSANVVPQASSVANNPSNFLSEQDAYLAGYNAIKTRNYAQASKALKNYIQQYPNGQYAASGHYWLGELYAIDGKTDNAIAEFQTVIQKYPNDSKVANAKLKIGFMYCDLGQVEKGKKQLQQVKKDYPGTPAARLATERLNEINRG